MNEVRSEFIELPWLMFAAQWSRPAKPYMATAMDHDGKMRTLREGTGQWTCMPGHADPANPDPSAVRAGPAAKRMWPHSETARRWLRSGSAEAFRYLLAQALSVTYWKAGLLTEHRVSSQLS